MTTNYDINIKAKIIHRKHNGWEFRALEHTTMDDRKTNIVYGLSKGKDGIVKETIELYRGPNYIPGDKGRSWSRCYKSLMEVPEKYRFIVNSLVFRFGLIDWKINWEKQNNKSN